MQSRITCLTSGKPNHSFYLNHWAGNLLWKDDQISAVLDWEEAGYGEPCIDVAYSLMDMALTDQPDAAETFLSTYESLVGGNVAHIAFWDLAATVRSIEQPQGWIEESTVQERSGDLSQML